jgi:hypothetical protein
MNKNIKKNKKIQTAYNLLNKHLTKQIIAFVIGTRLMVEYE